MPWEFDRLSPAEFEELVNGFRKREEREWYRMAWLATYVIAPHTKKSNRPSPEKLLGLPERPKTKVKRVVGMPDPEPQA